jgi:F0F1-type ATP synthase alpha subunit
VFYLHSRLLERAARVNEDYVEKFTNGEVKGKTGSLTACRSSRPRPATCPRSFRPT